MWTHTLVSCDGRYAKASVSEGLYVPPSGLGRQVLSHTTSSPKTHFGSSTRDAVKAKDSPSPVTYKANTSMMGDIKVISGSIYRRSAPSAKVGTASRDAKPLGSSGSAGPSYVPPSAMGKQTLSGNASNANTVIGSGVRFPPVKSKDTPGPGQYGVGMTAIGKQTSSTKRSPASFSFGIGRAVRVLMLVEWVLRGCCAAVACVCVCVVFLCVGLLVCLLCASCWWRLSL